MRGVRGREAYVEGDVWRRRRMWKGEARRVPLGVAAVGELRVRAERRDKAAKLLLVRIA